MISSFLSVRNDYCQDIQRCIFGFLKCDELYDLQCINKETNREICLYCLFLCKQRRNPSILASISMDKLDLFDPTSRSPPVFFTSGINHSVFAYKTGRIYTQGNNYFAQLGQGQRTLKRHKSITWKSADVQRYCQNIRGIYAADRNTYVITSTGNILTVCLEYQVYAIHSILYLFQ